MTIMGEDNQEVLIQDHKNGKTAEQRAFWHVLIGIMAKDSDCNPVHLKEWLKQEILGTVVIDFAGLEREATVSTERLNAEEYSDLIEHTYRIAAEAGIVLPNPRYRE